jgi:hypothetical protein
MKCYECAKQNKVTDAVSTCAICGKGLCMDHAHEVDIDKGSVSPWLSKAATAILCERDAQTFRVKAV